VRYGDDFLCFGAEKRDVLAMQEAGREWILRELGLEINVRADFVRKAGRGLKFLGRRV
jgi:hypothetical protein